MNLGTYPVVGRSPGGFIGDFEFSPNGTDPPSSTYFTGSLKPMVTSVTYGATGVYTIVFTSAFVFPNAPIFMVSAQVENLAGSFVPVQVGAYNTSTRTLVIQAVGFDGDGAPEGIAVAASTGAAKINIMAFAKNTSA